MCSLFLQGNDFLGMKVARFGGAYTGELLG